MQVPRGEVHHAGLFTGSQVQGGAEQTSVDHEQVQTPLTVRGLQTESAQGCSLGSQEQISALRHDHKQVEGAEEEEEEVRQVGFMLVSLQNTGTAGQTQVGVGVSQGDQSHVIPSEPITPVQVEEAQRCLDGSHWQGVG